MLRLCRCDRVGEMNNNIKRQVSIKSSSLEKVKDGNNKLRNDVGWVPFDQSSFARNEITTLVRP